MNRNLILVAIPIALLSGHGRAPAAEIVVLQSNTSRYSTGSIIDSNSNVELLKGDQVLLSAIDGRYQIAGPYVGPPSNGETPDEESVHLAMIAFFESDDGAVKRTYPVRTFRSFTSWKPDSPWWLDPELGEENSIQCAVEDRKPAFWRKNTDEQVTFSIKQVSTGNSAEILWSTGQHKATWPDSIEVENDGLYLVRKSHTKRSNDLTLREIPAPIADKVDAAAWLEAKECHRQAILIYDAYKSRSAQSPE